MADIDTLILEDVRHAQGNHPLSQIFLEYYHQLSGKRPRVLGFLVKADMDGLKLLDVESATNSLILGLSDGARSHLQSHVVKPEEIVTFYEPSTYKRETSLCSILRGIDTNRKLLKKLFAGASSALRDVGPCAADLVWRRHLLAESQLPLAEPEPTGDEAADEAAMEIFRIKSKVRQQLKNWTFTIPNISPSAKAFNVTPKFAKLVQILQCFAHQGDNFRGIIFVHKRSTAAAIADMLRMLGDELPQIRPQALTSHDVGARPDIVEEFKSGKINLLVTTQFGEDGLDLPPCSCVVRFDLFPNHISYAHSRARANQQSGIYVLMVEQGNDVHRRIIHGIARLDPLTQQWVNSVATLPGGTTPPSSLLERAHADRVESDDEDPVEDYILDPTTGGRVYIKDSSGVIYKFIASHKDGRPPSHPVFEYEIAMEGGQIRCTVNLPPNTPLPRITGPLSSTKGEARRLACFDACAQLAHLGYLDHRFFPRPPTVRSFLPATYANFDVEPDYEGRGSKSSKVGVPLPDMMTDATGQTIIGKSMGTRCYVRKRPIFWKNSLASGTIDRMFPAIVIPELPNEMSEQYRTMCILARHPLPPLVPFSLFVSGASFPVRLLRCAPFNTTEQSMDEMFRSMAGRAFECDIERAPYFFVPMRKSWPIPTVGSEAKFWRPQVIDGIDWECVAAGASRWSVPLRTSSPTALEEDLVDAVIQDRWLEFTRRFEVVRLRRDLTPYSKPHDTKRESKFETILAACTDKRLDFEGLRNENQPIIEAINTPPFANHLNPAQNQPNTATQSIYLIPELCAKFTIPASVFRTALLLPAMLEALTTPSANAEYDYERLELLGDAFLKYVASIYLFVTYPTQQEGAMHVARQRIISNRVLLQCAREADVPQFVQSKPLKSRSWLPYNYKVSKFVPPTDAPAINKGDDDVEMKELENDPYETNDMEIDMLDETEQPNVDTTMGSVDDLAAPTADSRPDLNASTEAHNTASASKKPRKRWEDPRVQWLGDKGVADVVESLIGAACQSGGVEVALKVAKDIGCYLPRVDRWSDFGRKVLAPAPDTTIELPANTIERIESLVGAKYRHPHILAQALTHTSILGNELPCYERLEFLGDAVLDHLVIGHIFDLHRKLSPGALTLLKGAMVNNIALGALCVDCGLDEFIVHDSPSLQKSIDEYKAEVKKAQQLEYNLASAEGRMPGQYWVDLEPPKVLGDIVESLLGALLVCENFIASGAGKMYQRLLKPFYDKHITLRTLSHHPTKLLFELFQTQGCQNFEIIRENDVPAAKDGGPNSGCSGQPLPPVVFHDIILASAVDSTVQLASRRASFLALDALEGDPEFLARTCDCRSAQGTSKSKRVPEQKGGSIANSDNTRPAKS
ncbi:uncharacterized protein EI90DRAFT_3145368 [Cantharellus anzutake]|uniref:uncharacterized protein n=1 Tax=Cantharellus anzutake TaxID=1750568 RepID=UPI001903BC1B|nr:uncharacterized protein EI90DRAFT_3145368 [Cantharellus anzutake]KAF8332689.1 hypothetical protein EI90DRAFT_3145368 [Cantharellus anzutake]